MAFPAGRVIRGELLADAGDEQARRNLGDLRRINRFFGGRGVLLSLAGEWFARHQAFTALDVGAASGDMGQALRRAFPCSTVVSLDCSLRNLEAASAPKLAADAFAMPFPPSSFDLVYSSLFLHHFPDDQVVGLLAGMRRLARRAVIAIDLVRHPFARIFLPATRPLFGWHEITLHDGPVSVEAGFLPRELEALARQAGLAGARVRSHIPWFRLSISAPIGS
ncbi:MAG: methyltransferase domain-containing protein [Acidobacteria bacterium]|nr:methyltransferase domain-containing protein [Acidobacteriota bacterium]